MWFYECSPAYSLGSQYDVGTKNLSWSMQLEHWFNEMEKTGMPGIILENPKSSMEHISVQVLHSTTTKVLSSTKSFQSVSSILSTFHLRRLQTG